VHGFGPTEFEPGELDLSSIGVEFEVREPGEQSLDTNTHFLASEPFTEAPVRTQGKGCMTTFATLEVDLGRVRPVALIEVDRTQHAGHQRPLGNDHPTQLDFSGSLASDCSDSREVR